MGGREVIGLIAGEGRLPPLLASAARSLGHRVVAITIEGDGGAVAGVADASYRAGFGEMQRIIDVLTSEGVRSVLVAGRVSRSRLVGEGDVAFRERLRALGDRGDQKVFRQVVVDLLARAGITVVSPLDLAGRLRVSEGVLTRSAPTDEEREDVRVGMRLARAAAALELGQTVVLKRGIVLAVEAAEGTDETIRRGAAFAAGAVVAKAARPDQDPRFDLPVVGLQTIEAMAGSGARVLAVEAGATLLLDRDECLALADRSGIAIVGVRVPV
ncbi:MAG TPA: UDP-2,3-diacylglucosamine diphosphatase LpxI [bacterium]|nr:UDP-2,3-diacylglucosamine diphosphatase LpxI [bacterium]